jgi:predicted MFS family arabinose efflux permease
MLALVAIGVVATLTLGMLPVFAGSIVAAHGWGDRDLGWLASADMAGSAIACLLIARRVAAMHSRRVAWISLAAVVATNLLSVQANAFAELMALRVLAGSANGVLLAIVYTGLCHSSVPDRSFGLYTLGQLATQAVLLALLPGWIARQGIAVVFYLLAATSAASALLVFGIPDRLIAASPVPTPAAGTGSPRRQATLGLAAQAIYFLAPAALWSYFEAFGRGFGLAMETIGLALGASALAGIVGALFVIGCGHRCLRLPSMAAGTAVSVVAVICLIAGQAPTAYVSAACLFNFAWNFTFPYQMGVLAAHDRDGSVAVASLVVQLVALASGPAIAALLLTDGGYGRILWGSLGCYALSLALFARAVRSTP